LEGHRRQSENETYLRNRTTEQKGGDVAQVVESKCEALSSIPSTTKQSNEINKRVVEHLPCM
jgi:hypothetical protein